MFFSPDAVCDACDAYGDVCDANDGACYAHDNADDACNDACHGDRRTRENAAIHTQSRHCRHCWYPRKPMVS